MIFIAIGLLVMVGLAILIIREVMGTEARLNPDGSAFELNLDDAGKLWISDYKSGEIWNVDPISGAYEIYGVRGSPIDARQRGGQLWWADAQTNVLGSVSTSDGTYFHWQVPEASGFLGSSIDNEGRFYATDSSNPYLYRLDPTQAILCTFALPGFGASNYLTLDGDYLWIADSFDSTLLQLNITDNTLARWVLPPGSSPSGMAVDDQGNLWYADPGTKMLVRFNLLTNQLTGYLLPKGDTPQMIAIQPGMIWYTEQRLPSIGRLNPAEAVKMTVVLTREDQPSTPTCNALSPSNSGVISITEGKIELRSRSYREIVNEAGWQIYQLPKGSEPWGIQVTDYGYVVDSGRQVLIRFTIP